LLLVFDQLSTSSPFIIFLFMELAGLFFLSSALFLIYSWVKFLWVVSKVTTAAYENKPLKFFMISLGIFMYLLCLVCLIIISQFPQPILTTTCATTVAELNSINFGPGTIVFLVYNGFYALMSLLLCGVHGYQVIRILYFLLTKSMKSEEKSGHKSKNLHIVRIVTLMLMTSIFLLVHALFLIARSTGWTWSPLAFFLFILLLDFTSIGCFVSMFVYTRWNMTKTAQPTTTTTVATAATRNSRITSGQYSAVEKKNIKIFPWTKYGPRIDPTTD